MTVIMEQVAERLAERLKAEGLEFEVTREASVVARSPYVYVYVYREAGVPDGEHVLISQLAEYEEAPEDMLLVGYHEGEEPLLAEPWEARGAEAAVERALSVVREWMRCLRVVAGLTWVKQDRDNGAEVWKLEVPEDLNYYRWVKNYGPKRTRSARAPFAQGQSDPFSGWRFGSGGPFTHAGWWDTLDEALEGASAYALREIAERVTEQRAAADRVETWLREVTA